MAVDAWEPPASILPVYELKKRPTRCNNLELGAIRSLMKDTEARPRPRAGSEASQRVAALASLSRDQSRCERAASYVLRLPMLV